MNVNKNEHTSTNSRSMCGTRSSSAPFRPLRLLKSRNHWLRKTVNGIAVMNRPQTPIVFKQHKHPVRPPIGPRIAARRPAPPGPAPAGTTGGGNLGR